MGQRLALQKILVETLGSSSVYFQPPQDFKIKIPCIVYHISKIHSAAADNTVYKTENRYELTVIDDNPDSLIKFDIAKLPRCTHDRNFVTSGLYHDVFNIIF
jgi:hypothetical protein